jgi:hypothetical protein
MQRPITLVVADGSRAAGVLLATERRRGEVVVLDVARDEISRASLAKQTDAIHPREVRRPDLPPVFEEDADPAGLLAATASLATAAHVARDAGATRICLPVRVGLDSPLLPQALEWQQVAEDLLRHGLGVEDIELSLPLLELEPWQLDDLAKHVNAPVEPAQSEAA